MKVYTVEIYAGTDGDHQDEFLRSDRPKDIFRNSIVMSSLLAYILNLKYVFAPLIEHIRPKLLRLVMMQANETSTQAIHDGRHPGSKKAIRRFTAPMKRRI